MLGAAAAVYSPPPDPRLIELGRRLFFEPALSAGRRVSCASCHDPARAWAGGPRAPGGRDVESLLGAARPGPFFRDGRAATLEAAALDELRDPRAMGLDDRALSARLDGLPEGAGLLAAAGEAGSDAERAARALAAFLRAKAVSGESAFDRAASDPSALKGASARGLALFVGKGRCASCHSGPWLTDGSFYRVGLRDGDPPDPGREAVTPVRQMRGAFLTPPLRDAARTAPYMHDGSLKTLREVVEFFDRGGDESIGLSHDIWPIGLTAAERADLVAFLEALNGTSVPAAAPAPAPAPPNAVTELGAARLRRAQARRALSASDWEALRDAADSWARRLAAARGGAPGAREACLSAAAAAAGDLAEMAASGRGWPILAERWELAAEWSRQCGFEDAAARGAPAPEEDIPGRPGAERIDALLAREAAIVAALRGGAAAERSCRAGLTFDGVLSRLKDRVFDDDAEQNVMKQAVVYRAYAAVRAGDPASCDALTFRSMAVGTERTGAARCREMYTDMAGARALLDRDPSYVPLCRENLLGVLPSLPAGEAEAACRDILSGVGDPVGLCSRLSPKLIPKELSGACAARFRLFSRGGGPDDCRALQAGPSLIFDNCRDMGAYAQARASGDAARCGESVFCRLLMGAGRGLEAAQFEKLRSLTCRALPVPASKARLAAILDEADAELKAASAELPATDRAAAAALDRRAERSSRLRAAAAEAFAAPETAAPE